WFVSDGASNAWLSWGDLGAHAARWVAALRRMGVERGAHVASCLANSLEWVMLDVSAQTLGATHVAIDPREPPERWRRLWQWSGARFCVVAAAALETPAPAGGSERVADLGFLDISAPERLPLKPLATPAGSPLSPARCQRLASLVLVDAPAQMLFTSGSVGE